MVRSPAVDVGSLPASDPHPFRLDTERRVFVIDSASTPGRTYSLRAMGIGGLLVVSCDPCPTSARTVVAGVMHCRHRRAVAEFLAGLGLVSFDGSHWRLTDAGRSAPQIGGCPHSREDRSVDPDGVVRYTCRSCGRADTAFDPTS